MIKPLIQKNSIRNLNKRKNLYKEAQILLLNEAVAVPLYARLNILVRQPYVNYNYEIKDTMIYREDHLEYLTIEKR